MKHAGMIGLGIMGQPMAKNLLAAGFDISIWNRTPNKAGALVSMGAQLCEELSDMVTSVSHIVIMVYGPEALISIADTLASNDLSGKVLINSSTVSPDATMQARDLIEAAGGAFLDAPVSGSTGPAEAGELVFMVGGEETHLNGARDLFEAMARRLSIVGRLGLVHA